MCGHGVLLAFCTLCCGEQNERKDSDKQSIAFPKSNTPSFFQFGQLCAQEELGFNQHGLGK
jgi:hypothetical protein